MGMVAKSTGRSAPNLGNGLQELPKRRKQPFARRCRTAGSSADYRFVGCPIVHLRRTAASTGRTAASNTAGQRQQWAVLSGKNLYPLGVCCTSADGGSESQNCRIEITTFALAENSCFSRFNRLAAVKHGNRTFIIAAKRFSDAAGE